MRGSTDEECGDGDERLGLYWMNWEVLGDEDGLEMWNVLVWYFILLDGGVCGWLLECLLAGDVRVWDWRWEVAVRWGGVWSWRRWVKFVAGVGVVEESESESDESVEGMVDWVIFPSGVMVTVRVLWLSEIGIMLLWIPVMAFNTEDGMFADISNISSWKTVTKCWLGVVQPWRFSNGWKDSALPIMVK